MNTEQLKTAEQILKENLKNIHFQQADSTFHDVISSMQIFAFQESKRAVSEFKEKLKRELKNASIWNDPMVNDYNAKAVNEFIDKL